MVHYHNSRKTDQWTLFPTSPGNPYGQAECRILPPPSFLAHSHLSLDVSPPPGAIQPQSQLGAFLTRVQLWGSSYTVEGSSIGMCKDMGEMGILPVHLEVAICCGAPASLIPSVGRKCPIHSAQLEGPAQPGLRGVSGVWPPYSFFLLKV